MVGQSGQFLPASLFKKTIIYGTGEAIENPWDIQYPEHDEPGTRDMDTPERGAIVDEKQGPDGSGSKGDVEKGNDNLAVPRGGGDGEFCFVFLFPLAKLITVILFVQT